MQQSSEVKAYLVETLAKRVGCSPKTIRKNLHRTPGLFRVGRAVRFDVAAVERRLLSGSLLLEKRYA